MKYLELMTDEVNGIPVKHLSWSKIYELAADSRADSNNEQKQLLEELKEYLGWIMTMQTKDSNWVYVVVLGSGKPENCDLTWIEIVKKHNNLLPRIALCEYLQKIFITLVRK